MATIGHVLEDLVEEKVRHAHANTVVEAFVCGEHLLELIEDAIRSHAPAFGVVQRDDIGMLSADCRRPFPSINWKVSDRKTRVNEIHLQGTGDLRSDAVLGVGPAFSDDGDIVAGVQKRPCRLF